jgi:hypothetical protein
MRMGISHRYRVYGEDDWKLWVIPEHWNGALWRMVQDRINEQTPSKHPQTIKLQLPVFEDERPLFLKVFHRTSMMATLKDTFRKSKSLRALRQGIGLAEMGFNAPLAIAVGEQRRYRLLQKSFLLTIGISGEALPIYLHDRRASEPPDLSLRQKTRAVKELAIEVRRFHGLGFVHGDLIPWNILVSEDPGDGIRFYFMDNDRTGKYPSWIPQRRWRRNLVQLNRFPLPGVTLQDRMRFLHHYLSKRSWDRQDRRLISWLENKTRERRWVCDHVHAKRFRELMRWNPEKPCDTSGRRRSSGSAPV